MSLFDTTARLLAKWAAGTPPKGVTERAASAALGVPAAVWMAAARARACAFDLGLKAVRHVDCPVVSIGNLTAGGSGKTPLVLLLAAHLRDQGRRAAIVSRGYKRESKKAVVLVSDGASILADRREAGDEPLLLARSLPGVAVVVSPRRYDGALFARRECGAEIILLDDAFQHRALHRDLDIVLWDAMQPMESAAFLPRGFLREDFKALARARALIFTRSNLAAPPRPEMLERIRAINPDLRIFHAKIELREFAPVAAGADGTFAPGANALSLPPADAAGAFCGIGNPESFFRLLESAGVRLVFRHAFPDHHAPSGAELNRVTQTARAAGAAHLIITNKDVPNLPAGWISPLPLWTARAETTFPADEAAALFALCDALLPPK